MDKNTLPSNNLYDHDMLYFGCVEWDLFQRPQSLVREFARRGRRVFYVEPMLSIGSIFSDLYHGKIAQTAQPVADNVVILKPLFSFSTFRSGMTRYVDKYVFKLWFQWIRAKYQLRDRTILMMNLPYWWENILDRDQFPDALLLYDCCDDCRVHSRNDRILKNMERFERQVAGAADLCLATSDLLYTKLRQLNPSTYLAPNAVDPDYFLEKSMPAPPDMEQYERPIFGFMGSIYEHIDLEVVRTLSKLITKGTIVLVGYSDRVVELKQLTDQCKNIVYLGPRPYQHVPAYIRSFDVCLIPYKAGGRIDTVNPAKLNEYLIFGKPIIGLNTSEMKKYGKYVYLYNDCSELENLVPAVLAERENDPIQQERTAFAYENSWEKRAAQIEGLLTGVL